MTASQPSLLSAIRRKVTGLNRWVRLFLFGLASLLVTRAFEFLSDKATLDAAVNYQIAALASLGKATPQSTYYLFKESLGYDVSESRNGSPAYREVVSQCSRVGGAALATYLEQHRGIGSVYVAKNGSASCIPAPGASPLLDLADKSAADAINGPLVTLLPMDKSKCAQAEEYAQEAKANCLGAFTGSVDGWGKSLLEQASAEKFVYWGLVQRSLAPAAALADVVVHNLAGWSPGVVFRWLLLAAGLAASYALVRLCAPLFGESGPLASVLLILFAIALIPSGAVVFSALGALAAFYIASAALWLFGSFVHLVILPLTLTGGFFAATAYGAVLEAGKHEIDTTLTSSLDL
jgi:hypothetical protein